MRTQQPGAFSSHSAFESNAFTGAFSAPMAAEHTIDPEGHLSKLAAGDPETLKRLSEDEGFAAEIKDMVQRIGNYRDLVSSLQSTLDRIGERLAETFSQI